MFSEPRSYRANSDGKNPADRRTPGSNATQPVSCCQDLLFAAQKGPFKLLFQLDDALLGNFKFLSHGVIWYALGILTSTRTLVVELRCSR